MKKLLAAAFIALLALNAVSDNIAIKPDGDGSKEKPYLISKIEHLVWMRETVASSKGKYYKMTADIDATETKDWDNSKGFSPIGAPEPLIKKSSDKDRKYPPFLGFFDGNGHCISNLYINRPKEEYASLFGNIGQPGEMGVFDKWRLMCDEVADTFRKRNFTCGVKDLAVVNSDLTAELHAAGLAFQINTCRVEGCYLSGRLSALRSLAGLAAVAEKSYVSECATDFEYDSRYSGLAGIAGYSKISIYEDCSVSGKCRPHQRETHDTLLAGTEKRNRMRYGADYKGYETMGISVVFFSWDGAIFRCLGDLKLTGNRSLPSVHPFPENHGGNMTKDSFCDAEKLHTQRNPEMGVLKTLELRQKKNYENWDQEKIWEIKEGELPRLRRLKRWQKN